MKTVTASSESEAMSLLRDEALSFMVSGGRLTRDEWASLDPLHAQAFVRAGEELDARRASMFAYALLERIDAQMKKIAESHAFEKAGKIS